jgi:hypothetical protein
MSQGWSALKERPTAFEPAEAVIREARRRSRRRRLGIAAIITVLLAAGVVGALAVRSTDRSPSAGAHSLAQPSTPPASSALGTISGKVFIAGTKPIGIPNATLTLRSRDGLTRTVKASSSGVFRVAVPSGEWIVGRLTPAVLDQLCVTPRIVDVVASHRTAIRVQVECGSEIGGGFFTTTR